MSFRQQHHMIFAILLPCLFYC